MDAVLTAIAWRRATIIEHSHREWMDSTDGDPGYWKTVWREGRVVAAGGDSQDGLYWAEFSLWPHERVGYKTESYTGTFEVVDDVADADKAHQATFGEGQWRELKVGHTYRLEFGVFGRVRKVSQLT
jgi:hypothetical protein